MGDVTCCRKHPLQGAVTVIKSGDVIGYNGFNPLASASCQLVVGDFFLNHRLSDGRLGAIRIGKVGLERRTHQLIAGTAGEQLHLLVGVGDDALRVGGHDGINIALK